MYTSGTAAGGTYYYGPPPKKRKGKPLLIFLAILAGVLLLAGFIRMFADDFKGEEETASGAIDVDTPHVGLLYIEGTIGEPSDGTYNHEYVLDAIDGMMDNDKNKGIMLYINTPGGGVYESDEVYFKLLEYKEMTGRPVYAYLGSQATSGGYYIAAAADTITANRNCWTGSIGVIVGTLYDISGLLDKYGIKAEDITSGENKAMGGITEPLTDEQREIMQSLVDEAYDQFVGVVAEGRDLSTSYVKRISDGRIYSAKQAYELKLVDNVVETYDEAVGDMFRLLEAEGIDGGELHEFRYTEDYGWLETFIMGMEKMSDASSEKGDIAALTELMEGQEHFEIQYMCEVKK